MNDAYIYTRISSDKHDGAGVQRQEQACRELATQLNLTVTEVFTDNDISAYSGDRSAYKHMWEQVAQGGATNVIVWDTDRLYRRGRDLEPLIDLIERTRTQVHTVNSGGVDLTSAQGKLLARMMASVSTHEIEHNSERAKAAHKSRAADGRYRGGGMPYGYRQTTTPGIIEPHPEEAPIVQRIANYVLNGGQLLTLAKQLNDEGHTTKRGKRFRAVTLRHILNSPIIAGLSAYNGEIVGKGIWKPLVPEDDWRTIQDILKDPSRRTYQGAGKKYQGSGTYTCGKCGSQRMACQKGKGGRQRTTYVCSECNGIVRDQERVDTFVNEVIVRYLSSQRIENRSDTATDTTQLIVERQQYTERQTALSIAFSDGDITLTQLTAATKDLTEKIKRLDQRLAKAREQDPVTDLMLSGDSMRNRWNALDADTRSRIIDTLMVVTILPTGRTGRYFDPHSVSIEWK